MSHRLGPEDSFQLSSPALSRVEGEGALEVTVTAGAVTGVRLRIYEPPRFFEAMLPGRDYREPIDLTARICGICPVAYQLTASRAIEAACGVTVDGPIRQLRRLLYCGEWIESHVLHVAMLHAPDFLGYPGVVAMAADHPDLVTRALRLKKAGNAIVELLGGRPVHPVNLRLGGFFRAPGPARLRSLEGLLRLAEDDAADLLAMAARFDFPDLTSDYEFVALRQPGEYPIDAGRLASSAGLDIDAARFERCVATDQVPYSTALRGRLRGPAVDPIADRPCRGGRYLVGPLARYALNAGVLPDRIRQAARDAGLEPVCRNPFRSILVRCVEVLYALGEAIRIIDRYTEPVPSCVDVAPRAAEGHALTEAPRGTLYHRYRIGADGVIAEARIIPPTAQNQPAIEDDVRRVAGAFLDCSEDELRHRCEQAIRNHDPCISCATHFLDLRVTRL